MTVRVVAIEDDARYRESLEVLLRHSEDFSFVKSFASPAAAIGELEAAVGRGAPPGWDLVLMDLELPDIPGSECTRRIKALLPGASVVVLTVFEDRSSIVEAICAGADGYLVKRTPAERLLMQLRTVVAGGSPLSAGVARTVLDLLRHLDGRSRSTPGGAQRLDLTEREQEVLRCLVDGMSYKMIARQLDISVDTVRTHIRSVYAKLQVHSVAEAVSRALREKLV